MTTANSSQKSFLASLFDFGFTSFVTLRFLKVVYAIAVVLILIGGAFFLIAGLSTGKAYGILGGIVLAPIITLVYLILTRITFEIIAMFFRIGDNTFLAVQLLGGGRPGQSGHGAQPGFGAPAEYGSQAVPNAPWTYGPPAGGATPPPYGQAQPNYGSPNDVTRSQYVDPSQTPPPPPGQEGWGQTPPRQ
jgi:Domain of unknown function (DUF4282)